MHNLSVSGPGEIRAIEETEVCKFCHIPHNASLPICRSLEPPAAFRQLPDTRRSGRVRGPGSPPLSRMEVPVFAFPATTAPSPWERLRASRGLIAMAGAPGSARGERGFWERT